MRKFLVMLFLLSFVALVVGCGPSDVRPVSGKVTLDGEPLEGVSVRFTPKTGEKKTTSRGTTHEDGTYELRYTSEIQGALVGEHLVQIISETNEEDEEGGKKRKLPTRYETDSDLSATVTSSGENVFNFDLQSD